MLLKPSLKTSFVLVGAGRMGQNHLRAAAELGLTAVGICDPNPSNLKQASEISEVPEQNCFKDIDELFKSCPIAELAIVATTTEVRADLVIKLANWGCTAILCEKPMASSLKQCDKIIEACSVKRIKFAVNHQMRFMNQYTIVAEALRSGAYGELCSMNVTGGNFGLSMNGSHYIEAFNWLSKSSVQSTSAIFASEKISSPRGKHFEDRGGDITFYNKNGKRLNLNIGPDQGHGMLVTYTTTLGNIFVDELRGKFIGTYRKKEFRDLPTSRYGMPMEVETKSFTQADNVGPTKLLMSALMAGRNYPDEVSGKYVIEALVSAWKSNEICGASFPVAELAHHTNEVFNWA